MTTATRDKEIRDIHIRYADFYKIGGGLALVLFGVLIGAWIFGQNQFHLAENMLGYVTNVSTELLSVIATIVVIDRLNQRRERENYKQELIRQAGSIANNIAVDAIEQLRKAGWLTGDNSVLKGANLHGANLEKGRLGLANLQDVSLWTANLQDANLFAANLQNASLWAANLQNANLERAYLQNANLWAANLQNANLREARLQDANLWAANLRGSNLDEAKFNEKTVLPDADHVGEDDDWKWIYDKQWTPETDMTRYTDPKHPDFWEPEWVKREREEDKSG